MQVDDCSATVAGVERCLDLDQTAELSITQVERPVKAGDMATAHRVPHAKRIANDKRLASQVG